MNVTFLFYTCVPVRLDNVFGLVALSHFPYRSSFVRYMSFDFVTIPWHHCLIESHWYSSLKGCMVCCLSENCLLTFCEWIHCLLVLFALLVCLTDRISLLWTIISIVIRLAFRKTRSLRIFWPCAPFDPSFVSPAYPLWKQPAEPAPFRPWKAAARWRPLQVWNQPKASDRSQQSKSLKKRDVSWCV